MNTKKEFKKEPLVYLWGNTFPLFNAEAAIGYTVIDDILAAKGELIFYIKDGYKVSFGKKRLLDKAKKYGDLFLNEKNFKEHKLKIKKLFLRRKKLINKINNSNPINFSDKELINLASEYQDIFKRVFGNMVISRPECVDHLSKRLIFLLNKQEKNKELANEYFSLLITPTKLDIIKKEQIAKLHLLKNKSNDNYKNYVLKFPWVYSYIYTREEAVLEIKKDLKKEKIKLLEQKIKEFKTELKKIKRKKENILNKYNNKEINLLSQRLSWLGYNRLEIKSGFAGFIVTVSPLFEEIARRGGIGIKELVNNFLLKDIENLLKNKKKLSQEIIKERKNIILYTSKNKINFIQGKEAVKFVKEYLNQYLVDKKDYVSGTTASKGFVVARCRKMTLKEDLNLKDFKKGEILITEMTAPSMVPLMDRCVGIITNEGGIVSHAAIISREFGVPCIVGTGTGTQVFKTGDYIELDANKGVAKKINKDEFNNN